MTRGTCGACLSFVFPSPRRCSYNAVNSDPACGNAGLLNEVLRNQWNFTGFVVGDYDAWAFLKEQQQVRQCADCDLLTRKSVWLYYDCDCDCDCDCDYH